MAVSCTGVDVPTSVIVMCLSCLGFLVSTLFLIISVCVEQISDKDMNKTWVHPSILVSFNISSLHLQTTIYDRIGFRVRCKMELLRLRLIEFVLPTELYL